MVTTDESLVTAAQESLASAYHTTLLDSYEGLIALQQQVPLEAVLIDLDLGPTLEVTELVRKMRNDDEHLVLIGLGESLGKMQRRGLQAAGLNHCYSGFVEFAEVETSLRSALQQRTLEIEASRVRAEATSRHSFSDLIGGSAAMRIVYDTITRVAPGNATVMIRGESGTGKELVARAIVTHSPRSDQPFISVNCAALPETLIESELFGHEKGAFTGAHQARPGHIEMADRGTLFLDEIGTLDLGLQSKLLRVLEQHTVQRIGGKSPKKIDFRLITATNEDLEQAVQAGRFREDLYYRIHVVPIQLPPLREREGDIALLVDHFLRFFSAANGVSAKRMTTDALEVLEDYSWPGNVRELENLVQRLVLMVASSMIEVKHLPQQIIYSSSTKQEALLIPEGGISFDEEIARIEVAYLQAALRRSQGKKSAAAALLQMDVQKMKYLCRKYGLQC